MEKGAERGLLTASKLRKGLRVQIYCPSQNFILLHHVGFKFYLMSFECMLVGKYWSFFFNNNCDLNKMMRMNGMNT